MILSISEDLSRFETRNMISNRDCSQNMPWPLAQWIQIDDSEHWCFFKGTRGSGGGEEEEAGEGGRSRGERRKQGRGEEGRRRGNRRRGGDIFGMLAIILGESNAKVASKTKGNRKQSLQKLKIFACGAKQ